MPSTSGAISHFSNSSPSAPTGQRNAAIQQGAPYSGTLVWNGITYNVTYTDISWNFPNIGGIDPRTTTTETIGLASQGKLVTFSNSGAIAVTLNNSSVSSGFYCAVAAIGAGTATLTPSSGTINGAASLAITSHLGCWLFFDGTNWEALTMGSGSGGQSRGTVSLTTSTIGIGSQGNGSVALGKCSILYAVVASDKCRLRLYGTSAGRAADASRIPGVAAAWGVGLLVELILDTTALLTFTMQPPAVCENQDGTPSTAIYYTVDNMSGVSQTFSFTFTRLPLE